MTQEELNIDARLRAVEITSAYMLGVLFTVLSDEQLAALERQWADQYEVLTFTGMDAAMSDALADEVRKRTQDLLTTAKNLRITKPFGQPR